MSILTRTSIYVEGAVLDRQIKSIHGCDKVTFVNLERLSGAANISRYDRVIAVGSSGPFDDGGKNCHLTIL